MEQIIIEPKLARNTRALRAALMILPLSLLGCADDKKTDPPPANTFDLTVSLIGSGSVISSPAGIDCGSDCAEALTAESTITLSAIPASGAMFTGWGGDCSGSTPSCAITMSAGRAVTATFTFTTHPPPPPAAQYTLSVNVTGSGSVSSMSPGISCGSDCTENYNDGSSVTLTASPGGNQQFSGWQGACSGMQTTCTVAMTEARSVTAAFASPPTPNAFCDSVGYSTEKFNLTVPYCLDMRDDDYLRYPNGNPIAIANGDASVTDEPTGSYDGGHAAKFVPPTDEDYAGLGNFNFTPGSVGNRMNVRYLVYWGYETVQSGVKLNIMNDGVSTRPMVISREMRTGQNTTYPYDYMIPIPSQNVNEAPVINDPGYPNNPSFFIAGRSVTMMEGNYAHQWVCWEFEIITGGTAPVLNFYVHTRNGVIAYGPGNPYATHAWDAGAIDLVRASIGWYWGPRWIQSAEAYVKVSDVVISNSYIGPPAGFVQ